MADITACHARQSDEWTTPDDLYQRLAARYGPFDLDAAATADNRKAARWLGTGSPEGEDALAVEWGSATAPAVVWLNPPHSRGGAFVAHAAREATAGHATTVALLPSRTDVKWFHDHVWDATSDRPRPGVGLQFLKGRVRFGGPTRSGKPTSAPFPSLIAVFRAGEVGE